MAGFMVHGIIESYQSYTDGTSVHLVSSQVFLFAVIYTLGVMLHEIGHAAVYLACGLGWRRTLIGVSASVFPRRRPTRAQQVIISAAGPIAQAAAGAVVVAIATADTLVLIAGLFILTEGVLNLLLPISRNSDAAKLYRSIHACLQGRGDEITP